MKLQLFAFRQNTMGLFRISVGVFSEPGWPFVERRWHVVSKNAVHMFGSMWNSNWFQLRCEPSMDQKPIILKKYPNKYQLPESLKIY